MERERLRIGKVASRVGVSSETIRDLERRGLISPERDWQGDRIFAPEDVERISQILFPREQGQKSE